METAHKQTETIPTKTRSRSNTATSTKGRKRPQSRASTTSIHSAATQPAFDQQLADQPVDYQKQWFDHQHSQGYSSMDHHMTPEELVMHSASQLQNPREYGIDPALEAAVNHSLGYGQEPIYGPDNGSRSLQAEGYGNSFMEDDSPLLEGRSDEQDEVDSVAGVNGAPKKASKSSAANELEMRQLFQTNKHRSLPDVARELHGNERGPQSERTRQVFAMLWINQVCDKGKGSVPRGRVYANYVSRCATERVTVLNPASFGKLVRVLFPGLKTRRLGVRGESKYHYVNFSLQEDQPDLIEDQSKKYQPIQINEPTRFPQNQSIQIQLPADRAVFPSSGHSHPPETPVPHNRNGIMDSRGVYNMPALQNFDQLDSTSTKAPQKLRFTAPSENSMQEYEPISLPKIEPYVPVGTDPDAATALTALYRSHCTSLVDAIRFVKQKTFFHLFTSFHGTLTMPVQKLFASPSIAPWIEQCDFVMYQKMIRLLGHLTLEVVPQPILDTLQTISERLVSHIHSSFHGQPMHVIQAKSGPAALFASLLDRMYRVNLTAHAAANMLCHPPNRDQMYLDWITMVRLRKVAESVPIKAMDKVVLLLLSEIRDLLDPVSVPWEIEGATPYGEIALRRGHQQQTTIHSDTSTENVLDRWVSFLVSLQGRFPHATPEEIIWCLEKLGTAVMRDITIKSGQSFGSWWVTKCWIDEMISFMAEKGGFMEYTSLAQQDERNGQSLSTGMTGQLRTQYSSGVEIFPNNLRKPDDRTIIIPGPMDATTQAAMNAAAGHDDSGISMRTPDDEFSMSKFNFNDVQMSTPRMDGTMSMGPT